MFNAAIDSRILIVQITITVHINQCYSVNNNPLLSNIQIFYYELQTFQVQASEIKKPEWEVLRSVFGKNN